MPSAINLTTQTLSSSLLTMHSLERESGSRPLESSTANEMHGSYFAAPAVVPTPLSDSGDSKRSVTGIGVPGSPLGAPPCVVPIANPMQEQMYVIPDAYSAEQQAAFLWDDILRELDIPNHEP
ncbi:SubName: Full=Uncharacterized protein {ECO:0000313/EMBL:CCA73808.1} [Serendipita indica DSM 11827]|nr:SubName: Full=Uncharacterized protein {ECO:0000313/EMBL:CCA73808.1} [Serendipita indica DSM 11827]